MEGTLVVLVDGEVLAGGEHGVTIPDQRKNAAMFAEGLLPILCSDLKVAIIHGNKPQVGFVLFRSELASHILHPIPLDVCGADTQGASGYMVSQACRNVLHRQGVNRRVMCIITQTLVSLGDSTFQEPTRAIGPWFDPARAEHYREARGWRMVEEQGRGYRRVVPSPPPLEILEMDDIHQMVKSGTIVIAAGGGGIPVVRDESGDLRGVEAVVDTNQIACMLANHLEAEILLMILENNREFLVSRLNAEAAMHLSLQDLEQLLKKDTSLSGIARTKLEAAVSFLRGGGQQVVITTLRKLPEALSGQSGLRIGMSKPSVEIFTVR